MDDRNRKIRQIFTFLLITFASSFLFALLCPRSLMDQTRSSIGTTIYAFFPALGALVTRKLYKEPFKWEGGPVLADWMVRSSLDSSDRTYDLFSLPQGRFEYGGGFYEGSLYPRYDDTRCACRTFWSRFNGRGTRVAWIFTAQDGGCLGCSPIHDCDRSDMGMLAYPAIGDCGSNRGDAIRRGISC